MKDTTHQSRTGQITLPLKHVFKNHFPRRQSDCKMSSITECVETLKQLEKLIHSDTRTIILKILNKGEVLKTLTNISSKFV